MKKLMLMGLLGFAGVVSAQGEVFLAQADARAAAKMEADAAKLDADEARMREELDKARAELDKAAQRVAELSMQLGRGDGQNVYFFNEGGPRRAVLGVQIDPASGKEGARLSSVSPGSAAEEAGLQKGDVIISIDGKTIAGTANPNREVVEHMRTVKPEQKVKVRVLRAGKNKDFVVVTRPMMAAGMGPFNFGAPAGGAMGSVMVGPGPMPQIRELRHFWPGEFVGMELASITPKLGAYFGASDGVLVVQAPQDEAFKLEDGDVILAIDGRKPEDGAHAMRILRSYKTGEKLNLSVLRQRKPLTLAITMPERPEFDGVFTAPAPAIPPLPPVPAVPARPAAPPPGA